MLTHTHTHREHMQHSVSTSFLIPDRDSFFLEYGTSPRGRDLPAALAEGHTGRPRRGGWSAVGGGSGQAQGGPAASRAAAGLVIGGSGLWEAEAVGGGRGTAGGRGTGSRPCAAGTGGRRAALPSGADGDTAKGATVAPAGELKRPRRACIVEVGVGVRVRARARARARVRVGVRVGVGARVPGVPRGGAPACGPRGR